MIDPAKLFKSYKWHRGTNEVGAVAEICRTMFGDYRGQHKHKVGAVIRVGETFGARRFQDLVDIADKRQALVDVAGRLTKKGQWTKYVEHASAIAAAADLMAVAIRQDNPAQRSNRAILALDELLKIPGYEQVAQQVIARWVVKDLRDATGKKRLGNTVRAAAQAAVAVGEIDTAREIVMQAMRVDQGAWFS